ncbi:hypothetical protein SAMN05216359_105278 [Roseateles sp. YR242]|uniref:hypothetical protein n=1 Tax=Roseateles sp. YR242 TaxID=1855305 RepID=UPI0008BFFAEF|nr:hypothetical protein [Roseateles sp. YR242]SEL12252.1 hypothetical protein SAMN05216359_105278 [Roseateles sp. YR242]
MASANDWLADEAVARSIDITKYSNWLAARLLAILNRADARLIAELEVALGDLDASNWSVQRLEELLSSVRTLNALVYDQMQQELVKDLRGLVETEVGFQRETLTHPLPDTLAARFNSVSIEQVHAAAMARPFQGRLLKEWAASLESNRMTRIRDTVRMGYVEGKTVSQIVRQIRGTRAQNYQDGIIEIDRRHADSVVRTAVGHTAGYARDQVLAANADLLKAEAWRATLDNKTSQPCRIRDGLLYEPVTHKPIKHKVPWEAGPGRLHYCCRSCSSPVLKSWKELGGEDVADWTQGQRASMDGAVPADTTYKEWFERQGADRQAEILGPARAKLYRQGDLPLEAFSNNKGQMLTLEQLKERQPAAFKAAGL